MAKKMSRGLVALSASAIAAIYVTGYLVTQGADAQLSAAELAPAAPIVAAAPVQTGPGILPRTVPQVPAGQQPVQNQPSLIQTPPLQASPGGGGLPGRRGPFQGGGTRDGIARSGSSASAAPGSSGAPATAQPAAPAASQPGTATSDYRDGTYSGSGTSRRGGFTVAVTILSGKITDVQFTRVTTQYPVSRVAALPAEVIGRQSAQVDRVTGATYSVQAFQQAVESALAQAHGPAPAVGATTDPSSSSTSGA